LSKKYPVSHFINENGFYIGCHEHLSLEELRYMESVFEEFFRLKDIQNKIPTHKMNLEETLVQ